MFKTILATTLYLFLLIGCGDSDTSESVTTSDESSREVDTTQYLKELYISGIAIDGYIDGGEVEIAGRTVFTDKSGVWKIEKSQFSDEDLENVVISIRGGVDSSTGEKYEGIIRVPLEDIDNTVIGTPITTIVSAMINSEKNSSQAYSDLSSIINLPVEILKMDHLNMVKYGSLEEKKIGIKTLKTALIFQKSIEVMSEAIDGGSEESFVGVVGIVAQILNSDVVGADSNITYKDVLINTEYIAERLELDTIQKNRLSNISDTIEFLIKQIDLIDEDQFTTDTIGTQDIDYLSEIENEIKVADIISIQTEEIIKANFDSPEEFQTYKENFLNTIAVLGGINGLSEIVADNNSSSGVLYQAIFTDEAITERLQSINSLLKEFNIDNDQISEIIVGVSQVPYSYETDGYSQDAIDITKSIIEDIIGRKLSTEELLRVVYEMITIKKMLNEAMLETAHFEQ